MSMNIGSGNTYSRIDRFNDWTNSEDNYNNAVNDKEVEEFQMFDLNLSTYSSDLKQFAQEYISKFDSDEDELWNFDEFAEMATNGEINVKQMKVANEIYNMYIDNYKNGIVAEYDKDGDGEWSRAEFLASQGIDINTLTEAELEGWNEAFDQFNIYGGETVDASEILMVANKNSIKKLEEMKYYSDMSNMLQDSYKALDLNGDGSVDAAEFASQLYVADLDLEKYVETEFDVSQSIDGKLDYIQYQALSSLSSDTPGFSKMQELKQDFYNNFYLK